MGEPTSGRDLTRVVPFRTRLVFLLALAVLPALGLAVYGNLAQRRSEKAAVREGAIALSELAAARQNGYVQNARQLLTTLSEVSFLVLATDRAMCQTHLSNLRTLLPDYHNFGLVEADGYLFCSAERTDTNVFLGDRTFFKRTLEKKTFAAGDFQLSRATGLPALHFGYPIKDDKGKLRRVLYGSLNLARLSEAISSLPLPNGATVTTFDSEGNVLARFPDPENWVGKSIKERPIVQRVLTGKEKVFEMTGVDGIARLHSVTTLSEGPSPLLFTSVGIPLSVSFAHANEALLRHLAILGLVALAVWFVARGYAERFFLRPVQQLAAAAARLAKGDLSSRAGVTQGAEELVQLSRTFDEMAMRLGKRQAELEHAHAQIQALNQDLERRVIERTAQLEAANKELEAFTYSVSHDLRAPLRHISAYATALKEDEGPTLSADGHQYLASVQAAAREMGTMVDDLLRFSRTGRVPLAVTAVDLQKLVEDVLRELKPDTENRAIEWGIGSLPQVQADAALLRLALLNLLSNAVKYSRPRKPARIEVGALVTDKDHVIFVRDNGVGFDNKYADKLFKVFERLHPKHEFEGTGVGLANVHRIIHRHGGRVWAEGKEGEGATFYFALPKEPGNKGT